jgi:hypothetical protein
VLGSLYTRLPVNILVESLGRNHYKVANLFMSFAYEHYLLKENRGGWILHSLIMLNVL